MLDPETLDRLLTHPDLALALDLEVGVATSSFQCEGGLNGAGEPETNWSAWEREGRVERAGAACGLWRRFGQAASRCEALGLTTFRLSFEWARLAPWGERLEPRAVEGYASRLATLRRHGLEPIVTLQHFTHPAWLGEDFWLDPASPEVFARYASDAAGAVGDALVRLGQRPVVRWLTLNEPNMLALATYVAGVFPHARGSLSEGDPLGVPRALRALDHLLTAHVLAHRALHARHAERGWPAPDVGCNLNFIDVYGLGKGLFDLLRAPSLGVKAGALGGFSREGEARFHRDFFGDERSPRADAAATVQRLFSGVVAPELFERTLGALYARPTEAPLDHLAIDVYDPFTWHQLKGGEPVFKALSRGASVFSLGAEMARGVRLAEPWEWTVEPETLVRALRSLAWPRPSLPIDVDENGLALERPAGERTRPRSDGVDRPAFLRGYLRALLEARVLHGLPVRAWCYWTLVDNYELGRWAPRFGLYGLGDPTRDGVAPTWQRADSAGHDAASVLGGFARALAEGRLHRAALAPSLRRALTPPTAPSQDTAQPARDGQ